MPRLAWTVLVGAAALLAACDRVECDPAIPESCANGATCECRGEPCESRCITHFCGDGVVDLGEECDDGNNVDADGCEADCTRPRCDNGIRDPGETRCYRITSVAPGIAGYAAVADLDGDGAHDIVAAYYSAQAITVILGTGGGGFGAPVDIYLPGSPIALAVGDCTGDGHPDVVLALETAYRGAGSVVVLAGDGTGGFSEPVTLPSGMEWSASSLALGDLNGDGTLDVIGATRPDPAQLLVWLSDGVGGFLPAASYDLASSPLGWDSTEVGVADFDRDGHLDVAASTWHGSRQTGAGSLWLGDGAGGLALFGATPIRPPFTVGDFNADGNPDIAWVRWGTVGIDKTLHVEFGDGAGGFGHTLSENEVDAWSPFIADLDADGLPEVIVGGQARSSDGAFGWGEPFVVECGTPLAIADLDGVPPLDIVKNRGPEGLVVCLGGYW